MTDTDKSNCNTRHPNRRLKCREHKTLLWTVDVMISIAVISPLVVCYWRGCWQLMDNYLFQLEPLLSFVASISIGIGIALFFTIVQDFFTKTFCYQRHPVVFLLFSRFYTILYCVACVNQWRGVWLAWDYFTGISWQSGVTSAGIGLLLLGFTRGVKNILAPPFVVVMDAPTEYFFVPLLFEKKRKKTLLFHILDSIYTVIVVGCLVVFVWRGSWIFLDRKLFPQKPIYSAWGSLVIGVTVSVLCFVAQLIIIPWFQGIKKGVFKILFEDFYLTICFVGAINIWRGVWMLLNIYLVPETPVLSNWISTLIGNILLMIIYCSNSILVRGGIMDGALHGSQGITLSTRYIRYFLETSQQQERTHPIPAEDFKISTSSNAFNTSYRLEPVMDGSAEAIKTTDLSQK